MPAQSKLILLSSCRQIPRACLRSPVVVSVKEAQELSCALISRRSHESLRKKNIVMIALKNALYASRLTMLASVPAHTFCENDPVSSRWL